jgi:predicted nucleic acid-binding Zn ribbon protein
VGEQVAAVTRVVEERNGTLVIECQSAVWSQELALLEPRLKAALDRAMDGEGPRELRFRAFS